MQAIAGITSSASHAPALARDSCLRCFLTIEPVMAKVFLATDATCVFLLMLQDPPAPAGKAPKTVVKTSAQAAAALRQRVLSNGNSSDMRVLPRAFEVQGFPHLLFSGIQCWPAAWSCLWPVTSDPG